MTPGERRRKTDKAPASGSRGVVVANHPLASSAGLHVLAEGGNAVDAAIAALFTLSVVEPMMVGVFGSGWMNLRLPDGTAIAIDNDAMSPLQARPDMYEPVSDAWPDYMQTVGRMNNVGALSVGVPGALKGWCEAVRQWGSMPLADLMQPAIAYAERGFRVGGYLASLVEREHADLVDCADASAIFLPDGQPLQRGDLLLQPELAQTLRTIAAEGVDVLYGGSVGQAVADDLQARGGVLTLDDLRQYRTERRTPLRASYRGYEVAVPPPPSSGGLHMLQILGILQNFDVAGMGFGSHEALHLLAESLKIAFADRRAFAGDPSAVDIPIEHLLSAEYAQQRAAPIGPARAQDDDTAVSPSVESANTTHVTAADDNGNVVSLTQTINSAFGARMIASGTGLLMNNKMALFDPHPGQANSVAPGLRMISSMCPTIVTRNGRPVYALGSPGGVRIFPSVAQTLVNLIDHGMTLQEAVEAPRVWTQGQDVEIEPGFDAAAREGLAARGHTLSDVSAIGGGMNGVQLVPEMMTGAACWRADGAPVALSGGDARSGVRFHTTATTDPRAG